MIEIWENLKNLRNSVSSLSNRCTKSMCPRSYYLSPCVDLYTSAYGVVFSQGLGWGGGAGTQQGRLPVWKAQGCSSENFNEINPDLAPVLFGLQKIPLKNGHNYIFITISLGQPLKIPWHLKIIIWLFIQSALSLICALKQDDEHLRPFDMGVPPLGLTQ